MRLRGLLALIAGGGLMAGLVAGCGDATQEPTIATANGATASAQPSASAPKLSDDERQLKFAQCMREHGVDMPDPEPDGGPGQLVRIPEGGSKEKTDAALEACKQYMPGGGEPLQLNPTQAEQMRKMSRCMRDNGVPDFPDPDANGRITMKGGPGTIEDPDLKAAGEKCQHLRPSRAADK